MQFRIIAIIVLAALLCILVTGCNGSHETDQVGFILLIGMDSAEGGKVNITYQIAVPRSLGSSESGGSSNASNAVSVQTVTASSLAEARNLLSTFIARSPNLSHNKAFVIGEDLARHGLTDAIAPLMRYREYRGSMYILVVQNGTAREFIKKMDPKLELLPSKYIETMMLTYDENGYYPQSDLHYFYVRLKSGSAAPIAPLVAVNPLTGSDQPAKVKVPGERSDSYTAINVPITDSNPITFAGTAIFRHDKMVGILNTKETQMLSILRGQFPRGFLVISDPNVPDKLINLSMRLGKDPKISAQWVDGRPFFQIDVFLEGEPTSIASGINYERDVYHQQLEQQVSQIVQQEIRNMLQKTQKLSCDVVGLGYHIRPLFNNFQEWDSVDWGDLYRQAEIQVKVTTKLRRSGLMLQTSPIK